MNVGKRDKSNMTKSNDRSETRLLERVARRKVVRVKGTRPGHGGSRCLRHGEQCRYIQQTHGKHPVEKLKKRWCGARRQGGTDTEKTRSMSMMLRPVSKIEVILSGVIPSIAKRFASTS